MCIIIDINVIKHVFDSGCPEHIYYKPVFDWVYNGKGKIVCGGSKYWDELQKMGRYIKIFNQLSRAGKIVKVNDAAVDSKTLELKQKCSHKDFDDPHIAALLIVSGCKVICTEDARSYPYITRKSWYKKGAFRPRIYNKRSFNHAARIISDNHIAEICTPCDKLNKVQSASLQIACAAIVTS